MKKYFKKSNPLFLIGYGIVTLLAVVSCECLAALQRESNQPLRSESLPNTQANASIASKDTQEASSFSLPLEQKKESELLQKAKNEEEGASKKNRGVKTFFDEKLVPDEDLPLDQTAESSTQNKTTSELLLKAENEEKELTKYRGVNTLFDEELVPDEDLSLDQTAESSTQNKTTKEY